MWFEKKKCPFPRFVGFRFCPVLEIENLETSENFLFTSSFYHFGCIKHGKERLKPFIEFQIDRPHVINILASNK